MGGTESSSDLDLGRRPELESDEFSVPPIVVIEKISLLCLKPLNRCGSFWEPDPVRYIHLENVWRVWREARPRDPAGFGFSGG